MSFSLRTRLWRVWASVSALILVSGPGGFASPVIEPAEPVAELGAVIGRVLVRAEGVRKLERAESGRLVSTGEALISGDATRFEVRPKGGEGLWRVGRRAVFSIRADGGGRLLAGTAFVQVPSGVEWRIESMRSAAALPAGSWLVQAVDNKGLKIVCLDGSAPVRALGDPREPQEPPALGFKLRPGELTFLQPGGTAFSPAVTIYLEETLATSRLINGFPEAPPGMRRLANQAVAQRERLRGVSNAVIVGASQAGGFQIAVPASKAEPADAQITGQAPSSSD